MGRKYKGDTMPIDSGEGDEPEAEITVQSRPLYRPCGIDPETCRRAQAIAVRQIQARITSYF